MIAFNFLGTFVKFWASVYVTINQIAYIQASHYHLITNFTVCLFHLYMFWYIDSVVVVFGFVYDNLYYRLGWMQHRK